MWQGILTMSFDPVAPLLARPAARLLRSASFTMHAALLIGTVSSALLLAVALASPAVPFVSHEYAGVGIVGLFVIAKITMGIARTLALLRVGERASERIGALRRMGARDAGSEDDRVAAEPFWGASAIQSAAFLGAVVMYVLVNHTKLFKQQG